MERVVVSAMLVMHNNEYRNTMMGTGILFTATLAVYKDGVYICHDILYLLAHPNHSINEEKMKVPEIDFRTFIIQLAQGALVGLGEEPDPETQQTHKNLAFAQYHIGVLNMLEKKTNNNLNPDEQELLKALLIHS